MTTPNGQRLLISRADLRDIRLSPDPDAPARRELIDGEVRLAIDRFALTANNITYAAFGEAMNYWRFFPAPDPGHGCLPVWGFAEVAESRHPALAVGRRVYGFLPAGSHLVVAPGSVSAGGFVDTAAHRTELAGVYNRYGFCDADPAWQPRLEGHQAVLRPLFTTAFLLDDFLGENGHFGANQVLLSSASSKTAFGTAFCLASNRSSREAPSIIGLTSPTNLGFARGLGCYDRVIAYEDLARLDASTPTVYVDFAGSAALRSHVHHHFDGSLRHSCSVGGTHWTDLGGAGGLPGPRPTLFFAPAQVKRRSAAPPAGWGRAELEARLDAAWRMFISRVDGTDPPWVRIVQRDGGQAVLDAYLALLSGRTNPADGLMLTMTT